MTIIYPTTGECQPTKRETTELPIRIFSTFLAKNIILINREEKSKSTASLLQTVSHKTIDFFHSVKHPTLCINSPII
jgi:hypothetical protein